MGRLIAFNLRPLAALIRAGVVPAPHFPVEATHADPLLGFVAKQHLDCAQLACRSRGDRLPVHHATSLFRICRQRVGGALCPARSSASDITRKVSAGKPRSCQFQTALFVVCAIRATSLRPPKAAITSFGVVSLLMPLTISTLRGVVKLLISWIELSTSRGHNIAAHYKIHNARQN